MIIVILSIGGIILDELATSDFPMNPTIIRVMRVLRITRGIVKMHITEHQTFIMACVKNFYYFGLLCTWISEARVTTQSSTDSN